jgi:cobalt/nickel transport system permease protein
MHVEMDKYSHLNSPVHRWDTRCKIAAFMVFIICLSFVKTPPAAVAAFLFAVCTGFVSRIPMSYLLNKLKLPLLFLLPLVLMLPVTSGGESLISIGAVQVYREGLYRSFLVIAKSSTILFLVFIMMGTSPFSETASALRSMRVPEKFIDIMIFTYRYIFVFMDDLRRMRRALILRGFRNRNSLRSLRSSGNLAGSMLVRSYERTGSIYSAMVLRGYTGKVPARQDFSLGGVDIIKAVIMLAVIAVLLLLDLEYRELL